MLMSFDEYNEVKTEDMKILFADLDGTVIKTKSGRRFPKDEDDWTFKNGFLKALKNYRPVMFHIVSNQGGIEKKTTNEDSWNRKVRKVLRDIDKELKTSGVYRGYDCELSYDYCISRNKQDRKRKPNPGMFEDFFKSHGFEDDVEVKKHCLMIGDASGEQGDFSDSDKKSAENFGIDYMDIADFIKTYAKN